MIFNKNKTDRRQRLPPTPRDPNKFPATQLFLLGESGCRTTGRIFHILILSIMQLSSALLSRLLSLLSFHTRGKPCSILDKKCIHMTLMIIKATRATFPRRSKRKCFVLCRSTYLRLRTGGEHHWNVSDLRFMLCPFAFVRSLADVNRHQVLGRLERSYRAQACAIDGMSRYDCLATSRWILTKFLGGALRAVPRRCTERQHRSHSNYGGRAGR